MRVGVDTARRPGRTSGHVSCLLGGDLSRIHPVFTGERGTSLPQGGNDTVAVRPVSCLYHGMYLSSSKMKT